MTWRLTPIIMISVMFAFFDRIISSVASIPAAGGPDAPREGYIAEKGMDPCVAVASYTGQRIWKIIPLNNQ